MLGVFRFILALAVYVSHLPRDFGLYNIGEMAVVGFFLASGFLMEKSFPRFDQQAKFPVASFYLDRFLKTYPLYFIVFTLTFALLAAFGPPATNPYLQQTPTLIKFIFHLLLLPLNFVFEPVILIDLIPHPVIPPAWSLSLEWQFYLLVPLLVRFKKLQDFLFAISFVFLVGSSGLISSLDFPVSFSYRYLPGTLAVFLLGMTLSRHGLKHPRSLIELSLYALLTIILMIKGDFFLRDHLPEVLLGTLFGVPALLWSYHIKPMNKVLKNTNKLLGELSYPLFLCHFVVFYLCETFFALSPQSFFLFGLVSLVGSFFLSYLLYLLAERLETFRIKVRNFPSLKETSAFSHPKVITTIWPYLSLFVILLAWTKIDANDTWWHLKLGQWMLDQGTLYTKEVFTSLVYGLEYIPYEWLSQLLLSGLYLPSFDPYGVSLGIFKVLLTCSICVLFYLKYLHQKINLNNTTYFLFILLCFLVAFRAEVRPHLLGLLFSGVFIMLLDKDSTSRKDFFVLFALQILWVNIHGSFILGPVLVLLYEAKRLIEFKRFQKERLYLFGAILIAGLVNPFFFKLYQKTFTMFFTGDYLREFVYEWRSLYSHRWGTWFWAWHLYLLLGTRELLKSDFKRGHFLFLLIALILPITGIRYLSFSAMLLAPLFLKSCANNQKQHETQFPLVPIILIPMILLLLTRGYPKSHEAFKRPGLGFDLQAIPLDIFHYLKVQGFSGNLMALYNDGGAILYFLGPKVKPLIDSRTELYQRKLMRDHHRSYSSKFRFERYVNQHNANAVLVNQKQIDLRNALFEDQNWKLARSGFTHDLFLRANPNFFMGSLTSSLEGEKQPACLAKRHYGLCPFDKSCGVLCEANDEEILKITLTTDKKCVIFSRACEIEELACGPCKNYCYLLSVGTGQLNEKGRLHEINFKNCQAGGQTGNQAN